MKNCILATLLSAIVLFVWGFISWGILPWHMSVANEFTSEAAVAEVLGDNAPAAGVYYLPFAEEDHRAGETAAFANVLPNGFDTNMGKLMGISFVGQLVSAGLVLLLLCNTSGLSYCGRVGFVALVGLVIGFVSHFPYWNWFSFSTPYVVVITLDTLIAWTLAGLVMAWFVTGKQP